MDRSRLQLFAKPSPPPPPPLLLLLLLPPLLLHIALNPLRVPTHTMTEEASSEPQSGFADDGCEGVAGQVRCCGRGSSARARTLVCRLMEPMRRNLAEVFPGWRVSEDDERVRLLSPASEATTLNNPTPNVPPTAKTPPDCVESVTINGCATTRCLPR